MGWSPSRACWGKNLGKGARVLMVSASFHPAVGGAEKQALELSIALRRRGSDVRVLTRRRPGLPRLEEVRGVPVERLWCSGAGPLDSLTFLLSLSWRLLRGASGYDVVHVHLAGSPALPAAAAGRLLGKRVLIKLGGGKGIGELAASAQTLGGRLKLCLLAWLQPQFVAVTGELAGEAERYLGTVSVRFQPNGVDINRYRPARAQDKAALRQALGWPAGLCFLYVGRFSAEKRLDAFIDAWRAVEGRAKTGACLVLVGEGPESQRVKDAAARAPSGRVLVRPAMEDIERAYAAADVFVLPSVSEGLSNALLEAMASGLAVLASRVGGASEAVVEGVTGFLFEPLDEEALKAHLNKLLHHPALSEKMGQASRRRALERFSIEAVAEAYEGFYEERS